MRNRALHIIALLLLAQLTWAQEPLSLGDAIQRTLQNNYQIQIAESREIIAQNNNDWGAAGLYPSLTLIGGDRNQWSDPDNPAAFLNFPNRNIILNGTLQMDWVLFSGFRVYIQKDRLELLEAQSAGNTAIVVENTIQAVILAYYDALVQQEKLEVVQEVLTLSNDRYRYELEKKELGVSGTFQELQFRTAYLSDSSTWLLQQIAYENAITNLNIIMAEDEDTRYTLSDTLIFTPKEYQVDTLREKLLSNNATLRNQFINAEIFKKEIKLQKANLYPTLSMSSGVSRTRNYFKADEFPIRDGSGQTIGTQEFTSIGKTTDYYVNFSVSFNLFNGGNVRRAINNAKVQEQIANLNIEDARQTLSKQMEIVLRTYNQQRVLVSIAELNIESARLNVQLAEDRFKNGTISSLDYRDIQTNYLNIALARLEALQALQETETELMRLTGGIIDAER